MKTLKNLFLIGGIAGIFGGCGKLNVEEYVKQNQEVYSNFENFVKEKGEKDEENKTIVYAEENFKSVYYDFTKYDSENPNAMLVIIKEKEKLNSFLDFNTNGLDTLDQYIENDTNSFGFGKMSENKKLQVVKKYTNAIQKIMDGKGQYQRKIIEEQKMLKNMRKRLEKIDNSYKKALNLIDSLQKKFNGKINAHKQELEQRYKTLLNDSK